MRTAIRISLASRGLIAINARRQEERYYKAAKLDLTFKEGTHAFDAASVAFCVASELADKLPRDVPWELVITGPSVERSDRLTSLCLQAANMWPMGHLDRAMAILRDLASSIDKDRG